MMAVILIILLIIGILCAFTIYFIEDNDIKFHYTVVYKCDTCGKLSIKFYEICKKCGFTGYSKTIAKYVLFKGWVERPSIDEYKANFLARKLK